MAMQMLNGLKIQPNQYLWLFSIESFSNGNNAQNSIQRCLAFFHRSPAPARSTVVHWSQFSLSLRHLNFFFLFVSNMLVLIHAQISNHSLLWCNHILIATWVNLRLLNEPENDAKFRKQSIGLCLKIFRLFCGSFRIVVGGKTKEFSLKNATPRETIASACVCVFVRNDRKSIHSNNCNFRFSLAFFWHRRSIITGKADSLLGHCVSCAIRKQIFREIIIDLDNEWLIVYVCRSPSQFDRRIRHCLFWKWLFNK